MYAAIVLTLRQSSQLLKICEEDLAELITQGFKANPGLKLANAFSVVRLRLENAISVVPTLRDVHCQNIHRAKRVSLLTERRSLYLPRLL